MPHKGEGPHYKPASLLSGEWINTRVDNVVDDAIRILDHVLVEGLLSSGYFPFEQPVTPEMVRRMTEEQLGEALLANQETGGTEKLMKMAGMGGDMATHMMPDGSMMAGGEMA